MIDEFKNAMLTSGIVCREAIISDGQIHRFANQGKGKKDGWYVYHDIAGAFGDWSQDIQGKWSAGNSSLSTRDHNLLREQQEKSMQTAEAEKIRKHEETAAIALSKWNSLSETGSSLYLEKKKVGAYGVRFGGPNLIIPLKDTGGKLWSFQWIEPDGKKQFLKGGKKKGCFHTIGVLKDGKPIYIVEGYSTGASVHMATLAPVVVAFDAGNLDPVMGEIRKAFPDSTLIIAGDDDVWKDHNTGRAKAQQAALKYSCSVAFPSFKDPSSKPTDFNDLLALEGLESVKQQLNKSQTAQSPLDWPEPTPLKSIKKDLSPVIPLPAALIPEPYQPWLTDIAERMQCPLDYVAVAALIETAALIGAGCRVRPKRNDSWSVVPNLWGGIVGRPSTLKSPSLKEVLKPMKALEEEANAIYEKEYKDYLCKVEEYKAHREAIKKKITKVVLTRPAHEVELVKQELRDQKEPEQPIWKRYSTNDTTIEKMHQLLSQNPRGLMVFRDELMGLLSTWDREGHEEDRSFYLEAWNGDDSKTSDRIGRGTTYTKSLCVSILGSTQPDKLFAYFQQSLSGSCNDGLLQRFQLLIYPDDVKEWNLVDKVPNKEAQQEVARIMRNLSSMNFCDYGAVQEDDETPYFCFNDQAQQTFFTWLTELEREKLNSEEEPILLEHFAKYRKLMPSLALIFHLINVASGKARGPISVDCVERAAAWCEYLEGHSLRVYTSSISAEYQAARNLVRKIQKGELQDNFDHRDIYRKHWALLKTKEEVESACNLLVENGWLREGTVSESRKIKACYLINPAVKKEAKL